MSQGELLLTHGTATKLTRQDQKQRPPGSPLCMFTLSPRPSTDPLLTSLSLGAQWGDEGKGKLVDILAAEADICARCAGGNNAGHTIVVKDAKGEKKTYAFNLLPSGESSCRCSGPLD
jgi:hypothetical protein